MRLHIEMCRHPLHENALQRPHLRRLARQDNNICPKPFLKARQSMLKAQHNEGTAKESTRENRRHKTERSGARGVRPTAADGEKTRERSHAASPFRYT